MANDNLFQELHDILEEFETFLDDNVGAIAPAVQSIASLFPQIVDLIDQLIGLMNSLKTEINNLDVTAIPGLEEATQFIDKIKTFLNSAKSLLPDEQEAIDSVLEVADVVGSLSGLDDVKADIVAAIDAIVAKLGQLKPTG